jgi:hypothetical protein
METHMHKSFWRSRWWMPAFSLGLGLVVVAAFAIGGNVSDGLASFAVMALLALIVAVGGRRSETIDGLSGPGRDERWAMIDLRATAFAGLVLIVAVIGGWLYEVADGQDGNPYGLLAAAGGLAYLVAVAVQRVRG